jgi:hypothetical protein
MQLLYTSMLNNSNVFNQKFLNIFMVITSSALVSLWQRLVNGKPIGKLVNEKYQRSGLQNKV